MDGPCIALDVSKGKSYYQGFMDKSKPMGKAKLITHSKEGFDEMMTLAMKMTKDDQIPTFIFEATGIYHKSLQSYLDENNAKYIILNPLEAAKIRKSHLRSTKTDQKDCENIAVAYYSRVFRIHDNQDEVYDRLQRMNRHYGFMVQQLRMIKVQYRAMLDIVYPNFDRLYGDVYGEIPVSIIKQYPHPKMLLSKRSDSVAKHLERTTHHRLNYCELEEQKIRTYVENIQSGCSETSPEVNTLKISLESIEVQTQKIENQLDQMTQLVEHSSIYKSLLSIPGVGANLAVRLIAEIGDITRFDNKRQLVAYAGIDPRVYQSGQMTGEHLHITKKGNKYLRTLLYLVVENNIKMKSNNDIRAFYYKKKQQTNPLSHKAAVIASANKLLRIIYGMCTKGTMFNQ